MIQISQYMFIHHSFLFWTMENIIFFFFFCRKGQIHIERTLFHIYRYVFFDENHKELDISERNVFFLKFYFLWSKNYKHNRRLLLERNPTVKINKRLSNIFSVVWYRVFDFCNNFLFNFFLNDMKMLVLDTDHKNYNFFLTTQFNTVNVSDNFSFFFPNPKNFSRWNWYIYFEIFCERYNISAFFVSDTVLINKNVSRITSLGIPLIAFLTHTKESRVDYSFFFRVKGNDYYYMLASLFVNYAFFFSLNHRLRCFKFVYIKQMGYFVRHVSEEHYDTDYLATHKEMLKSEGLWKEENEAKIAHIWKTRDEEKSVRARRASKIK